MDDKYYVAGVEDPAFKGYLRPRDGSNPATLLVKFWSETTDKLINPEGFHKQRNTTQAVGETPQLSSNQNNNSRNVYALRMRTCQVGMLMRLKHPSVQPRGSHAMLLKT